MATPRKTREEVLRDIQRFVEKKGIVPDRKDFEIAGNDLPSLKIIARYFRQWQIAVQEAGFVPRTPLI